ncbi:MAG: HAD hydrolase-like protein, partial [Aquitalea sp.]|nr:HAD hydrolase-like protein [Aquitalea sp.]
RTVMIGDTSHDLNMALNARAHGVGVSYGAHATDLLQACQPQTIVHSFAELQQWLLTRLD